MIRHSELPELKTMEDAVERIPAVLGFIPTNMVILIAAGTAEGRGVQITAIADINPDSANSVTGLLAGMKFALANSGSQLASVFVGTQRFHDENYAAWKNLADAQSAIHNLPFYTGTLMVDYETMSFDSAECPCNGEHEITKIDQIPGMTIMPSQEAYNDALRYHGPVVATESDHEEAAALFSAMEHGDYRVLLAEAATDPRGMSPAQILAIEKWLCGPGDRHLQAAAVWIINGWSMDNMRQLLQHCQADPVLHAVALTMVHWGWSSPTGMVLDRTSPESPYRQYIAHGDNSMADFWQVAHDLTHQDEYRISFDA